MEIKIRNWQREELAYTYGPEYIAGKTVDELAALWAEHIKGNQAPIEKPAEPEIKKPKKIRL